MKTYDFWDKMGQASLNWCKVLSIKGLESVAELKSTR